MGFSPTIKQQVMNDSARHCCVCHRYKGIKIEVHHIKQEADGGSNTYENAIPLCFDCHSDAGHFNDRHPRGTKFSIPELINARNKWYEFVKKNPIVEKRLISNHIHSSYYVLHSFDILESTIKGTLSTVNKYRNRVLLSENLILKEWKSILDSHKKDFGFNIEQRMILEIRQFSSIEEYFQEYEGVEIIDKTSADYPYYEAKRKTDWSSILSIVKPNLFLDQLSKSGIKAEQFCTSLLHKNGETCGGEVPNFEYTEYLEISPLSFIFLGLTNASKEQIKLNSLLTKEGTKTNLPNFNLLSYEMVLLPIATAINLNGIDRNCIILEHIDGDRGQDFSRVLNSQDFDKENVCFFINRINPISVIYNDNHDEYEVEIHDLDFNNLYSINSYWQCGSCPHLFYINIHGHQEYVRELLVSSSYKKGIDNIVVPKNIFEIVIRELEDEITHIDKIRINNKIFRENILLRKGESLIVKVNPDDKIVIEGSYEPYYKNDARENDIWRRNEIIKGSNIYFNLAR
ncbi:MAG: hypothetical protein A2W98_14675 [Bacteroidetes bacterium GWF2_33_38]|nr:MAG: hypothetical protein A2W98_14675 [Bacteroidetes bacterium GWF2_33_38]OFY76496.1 MAG: hypothetical protein A2265_08815 [Bacteroidetes bacterium RIFOXYA12_FULL_33_9]OFY92083.1 MAG: hypothetical protein A2236_07705 [Bacteroidetes bacterium RIFOXYA2_FULL_33_7]HBX52632.1 hypothetical protein [Bacteroidales bacterium]